MLSFIVPAHNEEHELAATLVAIDAAATASSVPYEIVVVDDASTDATGEIARQHGARVISVQLRQIAADPARSHQYLLDAAMISSLRRSGMLR